MALSLVQLLSDAVRRHAGRAALGPVGGAALTYRELERRSRQVAAALLAAGVRRGDRVGLLVPKSTEAVVGIWGALRAGAAYVPIDPLAPPRRAAYIASNCGLTAALVSSDLADRAAALREAAPQARLLHVHGEGRLEDLGASAVDGRTAADAGGLPAIGVNPKDLAYVLYTSGSTGEPKGVMVTHGAALAFIDWAVSCFDLRPTDVLSSHAPFHFDLSTFDLFAAAAAAARVVVLDEEIVRFPAAASEAMESEGISVWYSVPSALRMMMRHGALAGRRLPALRTLLFAGEVYPAPELRELQAAFPDARLYNLYGPTETNVCTCWPVPPAGTWDHGSVPIGFDCDGCQGCIVDDELRPVPDGTVGELVVRGGTLMEGYWGDPARTAQAFVSDFLFPHLGDRFYRTGDLVSRGRDGAYRFHGRKDSMVKIRGHRIELSEVEAALHAAPEVADAAVVTLERGTAGAGELEMVAFLVPAGGDENPAGWDKGVRSQLAQVLPKYMHPSDLRWVDRLPRTSNGKVDRLALAARLAPGSEP